MKVAKIKIDFFILVWRDLPFSHAAIRCDFMVILMEFNHLPPLLFYKSYHWAQYKTRFVTSHIVIPINEPWI